MDGILVIGTLPSKEGQAEPRKWALFDLDWTLIRPNKGKFHKIGVGWNWLPGRIERLKDFLRENYTLGIVTNQKPWPQQPIKEISSRLNAVHQDLLLKLGVDVPILAGLTNKAYRKPETGWFNHLLLEPGSLMVGDAAGRPCDYSDADRKFAEGGHLPFYTPEQVFPINLPPEIFSKPMLIILMGAPGSGKSTWAEQISQRGWTWIQSDQFKSNFNRIYSATNQALQRGEQVIVDATNPTRERRLQYVQLAQSLNVPSAILHFLDPGEDRNRCRAKAGGRKVPPVAYSVYWKNYQPPDTSLEGPVYEII